MPTKLHNKLLNLNKHKGIRQYIIQIYSNFVGTQPRPLKRLRNIAPFGKFCFSLFLLCGLSVILDALPSSASSVSISVTTSPQPFDLLPTTTTSAFGKSNTVAVEVTTDYASGYTLTIAGQNDTRTLIGSNDSNHTIPSIETAISESTFQTDDSYNNMWGFFSNKIDGIDNADYHPAPTLSTPTTIDMTSAANTDTAVTYTLAIAAKVDTTVPKDTYSTTFTLAATGNPTSYNIAYVDAASNMPVPTQGSTEESSVTLSSQVPVKDGYIFTGWCSAYTISDTCTGTTYQPNDAYNLNNGASTNLYAIWRTADCTVMQDISGCKHKLTDIGNTITMADSRDNTTYTVGKLADGNIWMLENLALGSTDSITLTGNDTNLQTTSATYTLPASGTDCFYYTSCTNGSGTSGNSGYEVAAINIDSANLSDAYGKYGVYYNYCAASAGSNCAPEGSGEFGPTQDICPKGWKLPTGGVGGQFEALYAAYNSDYSTFRNAFKLPLSGGLLDGLVGDRGGGGYFFSSTMMLGGNSVYLLYFTNEKVYLQNGNPRYSGNFILCVAQ